MRIGERRKREKRFTVCPRCGIKTLSVNESCSECGFIFSRLKLATNKDAKKKIKKRDKDFIIMTNQLPSDVSWIKLLCIVIFGGIFGSHCFYVGRYWRGALLLVNFLLLVLYVVFNSALIAIDGGRLLAALSTISGIVLLVWVYDLITIIIKKFKVPVAIDLEGETLEEEQKDKDEI